MHDAVFAEDVKTLIGVKDGAFDDVFGLIKDGAVFGVYGGPSFSAGVVGADEFALVVDDAALAGIEFGFPELFETDFSVLAFWWKEFEEGAGLAVRRGHEDAVVGEDWHHRENGIGGRKAAGPLHDAGIGIHAEEISQGAADEEAFAGESDEDGRDVAGVLERLVAGGVEERRAFPEEIAGDFIECDDESVAAAAGGVNCAVVDEEALA